MSFWTDIRNTVTAPFRALGSFGSDLFSGKNVFDSIGKLATREISAFLGPATLAIDKLELDVVLDKLSPITLGVTGRVGDMLDLPNKINYSDSLAFNKDEVLKWGTDTLKTGAITAATLLGSPLAGGAAAGGIKAFESGGGFSSLFSAAAPFAGGFLGGIGGFGGAGEDASDYYNQAKDAAKAASDVYSRFQQNAPPQVRGYQSSSGGYETLGGGSESGSIPMVLLVGGLGVLAYFLVRKK